MSNIKKQQASFQFNAESQKKFEHELAMFPSERKASALIGTLDIAQRQNEGWLSYPVMEYVADLLDLSYMHVLEVSSFYSMFNLEPIGRHHVQICTTTPCWLRGSDDIMHVCKKHMGLDGEGVSSDGKFSLKEVECIGACSNAPAVQINDDYYEDLDVQSMTDILGALEKGGSPRKGSQSGRISSEAVKGCADKPINSEAS